MILAELSVVEIAAEYNLPVEQIFVPSDRLKIAYKNQHNCLALEDARVIIREILSAQSNLDTTR